MDGKEQLTNGWQPIETAPRDWGTVLVSDGGQACTAFFGSGSWRTHKGHPIEPTHWMPLPDPPAASRKGDER